MGQAGAEAEAALSAAALAARLVVGEQYLQCLQCLGPLELPDAGPDAGPERDFQPVQPERVFQPVQVLQNIGSIL